MARSGGVTRDRSQSRVRGVKWSGFESGRKMFNALVVAVLLATTAALAQPGGSRIVSLNDLTVPPDRLPAGCTLLPSASERTDDRLVRGGSWAGVSINTNPWTGIDRDVIVAIRTRMEGVPAEPDGPPLSRAEAARFLQHLADGVDEAYVALYRPTESANESITVYGSRLAHVEDNPFDRVRRQAPSDGSIATRVTIGSIVAAVHGTRNRCSEAIAAYLGTLASR
jgi:hypothetical protein